MARPIPHLTTGAGLTLLASTPWGLAAAMLLSFGSHFLWDTLNWGEDMVYHGWGETKLTKSLFLALEIGAGGVLVLLAINYPWTLLGMALAMAWDIDHVLHRVIPSKWPRHNLHRSNRMWPAWARTEKGLWVWVVVIVLGMILIWK